MMKATVGTAAAVVDEAVAAVGAAATVVDEVAAAAGTETAVVGEAADAATVGDEAAPGRPERAGRLGRPGRPGRPGGLERFARPGAWVFSPGARRGNLLQP